MILNILLSHCQNPRKLTDKQGNTLLHVATSLGYSELARILMAKGFDLVTENRFGATPMDSAVLNGKLSIIKEFIGCYERSRHQKLLQNAQTQEKNISELLSIMYPKYESVDSFGNTSIHDAVQNGQHYLVKVLLEHGVNPNVQNNFLVSPLHIAVREYAKIAKNTCKETSRHISKKTDEFTEIIRLILSSCDNADCQDFEGNTALHIAAEEGLTEIVKMLMPLYENLFIENKNGITPLGLAYEGNDAIGDLMMAEIDRRC